MLSVLYLYGSVVGHVSDVEVPHFVKFNVAHVVASELDDRLAFMQNFTSEVIFRPVFRAALANYVVPC